MMLEAGEHTENAFVTLTYDKENEPNGGSLVPEHLRDWLKRTRSKLAYDDKRNRRNSIRKIRFYAVGEYGDNSFRPHYHAVLFGHPTCERGHTRHDYISEGRICCETCYQLQRTWKFGSVDLGEVTEHSAQYAAGYVVKKMTHMQDPRLKGRWPEFQRSSNRPGLGYWALPDLADAFLRYKLDTTQTDVPNALRIGGKMQPLGRYLKNKLREHTGMNTEEVKYYGIEQARKELRELRENKKEDETLHQAYSRKFGTRITSFLARQEIFKQRETF